MKGPFCIRYPTIRLARESPSHRDICLAGMLVCRFFPRTLESRPQRARMAIRAGRRHGYDRKRSTKDPRPSIVVLVEGAVTEVESLSALRDALGIPRSLVSISSAVHSDADGLVCEARGRERKLTIDSTALPHHRQSLFAEALTLRRVANRASSTTRFIKPLVRIKKPLRFASSSEKRFTSAYHLSLTR